MKITFYPSKDLGVWRTQPFLDKALATCRDNVFKFQKKNNYFPNIFIYLKLKRNYFCFNLSDKLPQCCFLDKEHDVTKFKPYLMCELDEGLLCHIIESRTLWNDDDYGRLIEFKRDPDIYLPELHKALSNFHLPNHKYEGKMIPTRSLR